MDLLLSFGRMTVSLSRLFTVVLLCLSTLHGFGQARKAFELSKASYSVALAYSDSSIALGQEAVKVAKAHGSLLEEARARSVLGRTAIIRGDYKELDRQVTIGLPIAVKVGNDTLLSELYNLASHNFRFKHNVDSANTALNLAEYYARKDSLTTQLANVLTAKAKLLLDRRSYVDALSAYYECHRIYTRISDPIGQGMALQSIGQILFKLKRTEAALAAFRQAITLQRRMKDYYSLVMSLSSIGSLFEEQGMLDSAVYSWNEAYKIASVQQDALSQGVLANNIAVYFERIGNQTQNRYWGKRAIKHFYSTGDSTQAAHALGNLGNAERQLGYLAEAKSTLIEAVALSEQLGDQHIHADNLKWLSLAYQDAGEFEKAVPLFWQFSNLQDSLFKKNLAEEVASLQAQIELSLKDQRIDSLQSKARIDKLSLEQARLKVQRRTLLGIVVALVLVSLVGIVYFRSKRRQLAIQVQLWEEQARRSGEALVGEERERKRIAQELHDSLGQMLATVRLQLSARTASTNEFTDLLDMLAESSDEVRYISHNLLPKNLQGGELDNTLIQFCERAQKTRKANLLPHLEPVGHLLSEQASIVLYRAVQELVSNAFKYSNATDIYLTVVEAAGSVELTIEDNGIGFDVAQLIKIQGIGLNNIRDRIEAVGGQLEIDSRPGNGSTFIVILPVSKSSLTPQQTPSQHNDFEQIN